MSLVDDLFENFVERNSLRLNGSLSIRLLDGSVSIRGTVLSVVRDQKRNRDILNINIPVDATVRVSEIVIPLPNIP